MRWSAVVSIGILISLSLPGAVSTASDAKTVIVLIDLSGSARELLSTYEKYFDLILTDLDHGDAFTVLKISSGSLAESEPLVHGTFEPFIPRNRLGNPTDNPFEVRASKADADTRLAAAKTELRERFLTNFRNSKSTQSTDILGAIRYAETLFNQLGRPRRILVLMSDMIHSTKQLDFGKMKFDAKDHQSVIEREQKSFGLPDLTGVKVHVIAAGGGDTERFMKLRSFWEAYFHACHAKMEKGNYASTMLVFDE